MFFSVPSCPIIEYFKDRIDFNVTVLWRPPKYYRHYVTHYRIAVSLLDEPLLMRSTPSPLGNRTSNNISCSVDTAVTQSRHSCINYTFHVTDDYSCDGGWCAKTITELRNYFKYQVEVQALSSSASYQFDSYSHDVVIRFKQQVQRGVVQRHKKFTSLSLIVSQQVASFVVTTVTVPVLGHANKTLFPLLQ